MKQLATSLFVCIICASHSYSQSKNKSDSVFTKWVPASEIIWPYPEIEAIYPEGEQKWFEFIASGLNRQIPVLNRAPKGSDTVVVKFVIDKNGQLTNFVPETNAGYGMEEELIRLLKTSPRWIPAKNYGTIVNSIKKQAVIFNIE